MTDRNCADAPTKEHDEMVSFGRGGSMPRDLYRRARRIVRLFWIAGLSPFALYITCALIPSSVLMSPAKLLNDLFWVHIRPTAIEHCSAKCHMVAYSLIGVPISWLASIAFGILAIPLTVQNWEAGQEAFRRGAAPAGVTASGKVKQPGSLAVCVLTIVLVGVLLVGGVWLLYLLAGSDRTISRDREHWPPLVSVSMTVIMGLTQFFAAAVMVLATGIVLRVNKLFSA